MQTKVDVAIAGGGPGGLSAATAVHRARPDLTLRVYERSQSLRPLGHRFTLSENGLKALDAIDPGIVKRASEYFNVTSTLYMSNFEEELKPRESNYGRLASIPWYRLRDVLAESVPEECLVLGHSLEGLDNTDSGVTLYFQNGETVNAKVLLGSDGNLSRVRELVLDGDPPEFLNRAIWRGVVERPKDWEYEQNDVLIWARPNFVSAFFIGSLGGTTLGWQSFAPWKPEDRDLLKSARYIDETHKTSSTADCKQRALDNLDKDLPDFACKLVQATNAENIIEHGQYCHNPEDCQKWGEKSVTLLGDAAHLATPALGQGVNQALIDGLEFGRAVGQLGPTPEALRLYESVRMPMVLKVQAGSVGLFKGLLYDEAGQKLDEPKWHARNPWCLSQEFEPLTE